MASSYVGSGVSRTHSEAFYYSVALAIDVAVAMLAAPLNA